MSRKHGRIVFQEPKVDLFESGSMSLVARTRNSPVAVVLGFAVLCNAFGCSVKHGNEVSNVFDTSEDTSVSADVGADVPDDAVEDGGEEVEADMVSGTGAYRATRTVVVDGVSVDVVIDKPANNAVDVLLVYHGTVGLDRRVMQATTQTLDAFIEVLDRDDMMVVGVAYPEENRLFGDNIREAEAALLWVRGAAAGDLGITVGKVFLAGHSQGGYLVTRLNTLHSVDGVVANAPGPIDLVYRCALEEAGEIDISAPCALLHQTFGSTTDDAEAYASRSLLRFTDGQKSNLLTFQGLDDSPIQLRSWPIYKEQLEACVDCQQRTFVELPGLGHPALFQSNEARQSFNAFLRAN